MLLALAKRKLLWSTGAFLCMASFWAITPETHTPIEQTHQTVVKTESPSSKPKTKTTPQPSKTTATPNVKAKYISGIAHPAETPGRQIGPVVVGTVVRTISPTVRRIPILVTDYVIRNCFQIFEAEPKEEPVVDHAVSEDKALALHDTLSHDSRREPSPAMSVATGVVKQHNPVTKKANQMRGRVPGGNLI
jgi:hypothetical protein